MKITKGNELTKGKIYMVFQIDHTGWVFDSIVSSKSHYKLRAGDEFLCLEEPLQAVAAVASYYDVRVFGATAEFCGWARILADDHFVEVTSDGPAIAELH